MPSGGDPLYHGVFRYVVVLSALVRCCPQLIMWRLFVHDARIRIRKNTRSGGVTGRPIAGHHRLGRSPTVVGLPRALIIVLGLAAGVVVVAGMRAIPEIIGPVFTALVLTISVNPIRYWLIRRGASRGVASLAVFLTVLAIVVGLFAAAVIGIVQLVTL